MLRREFGIGALEAEHELPEWERQMLLRKLSEMHQGKEGSSEMDDPFAQVPEDLKLL